MGLREQNAARTREMVIDTALTLFLEHGYDATTMEDVAGAAGIGTSTLYRYFPTKDLLLIEPLAFRGKLADGLRARPADEELGVALGHVLIGLLVRDPADRDRLARIRSVVEAHATPRMRLLELFVRERTLLEEAIAERLDRPSGDVFCVMTARLTTSVLEYVAELTRGIPGDIPANAAADERFVREMFASVTARLAAQPPMLPVTGPDQDSAQNSDQDSAPDFAQEESRAQT